MRAPCSGWWRPSRMRSRSSNSRCGSGRTRVRRATTRLALSTARPDCESKAASCRFQRVQLRYTGHYLCYAQLFEVCEVERRRAQLCTCTVFCGEEDFANV